MKIRSFLTTIIIVISGYLNVFSQNQVSLPVSPEASALAKMVNYPVSLNTGVPDISLPLYQIETGGMTLPIAINYHAGGFRINEMATSVGLGWTLSTDIQIAQTVNGLNDFTPSVGYIANTKMKASDAYPLWEMNEFIGRNAYDLAVGNIDGMPDKFNYKLLNKAGSFYFQKNNAGTGYTIVPVPYDNIKITYTNGQFVIVDTDGTRYVFGSQGSISIATNAEMAIEISGTKTSAWKCKTIDNPTKTEQIKFTYQKKADIKYLNSDESIDFYVNDNPCSLNNYWCSDQIDNAFPGITTYNNLLSIIPFYNLSSPKYMENFSDRTSLFHLPYLNFSNQVVDRTYTWDSGPKPFVKVYGLALAKIEFRGGSAVFSGADKLQSIKIQDANNTEVKTFAFFQSYSNSVYVPEAKRVNGDDWLGTLYLDSIQIKNSGIAYDRYRLLYNDKFCFGNHLKGKDAWGFPNESTRERYVTQTDISVPLQGRIMRFYKSITGSCNNFVDNVLFQIGTPSNTEAPHQERALSGIIKRIIYPTGGYVDFDFESNKYNVRTDNFVAVRMGGGLRIRSINYFDGKEILPVKQTYYKYGELEDGIGLVMNSPERAFFTGGQKPQYDAYSYSQNIGYITGSNFGPLPGGCTSRSCMTLAFKEKKTTYKPASSISYTYPTGAPIYYTKVTEYNQELGTSTGKKVHHFYEPNQFSIFPFYMSSKIPNTNIDILHTDGLMGLEYYLEDYKYKNGLYSLAHTKIWDYIKYLRPQQVKVAYSFLNNIYSVVSGNFSGDNKTLYNTNSAFVTGMEMEDDFIAGEYNIQVGKLLLNSETEVWYNDAQTNHGQQIVYAYGNSNYLQPTSIRTTNSKNEVTVKSLKYSYDLAGTGIYSQMVDSNMISQVVEETIKNESLNKEISKMKVDFGWSTAGFGFIAPSFIRKSIGGGILDTVLTYDRYDNYANVLQITEKDRPKKSYIWGYNYKYPVAEIVGASYETATAGVNVPALQTSTEAQLKNVFNGLRSSLQNTMIKSFTHKPFVGILNETSPSGLSSSYDYDAVGRLKTIKNYKGEIVKQYDYHVTDSIPWFTNSQYYVNDPMMATFYTTCANQKIRPYNFVVPGGKYWDYDKTFYPNYSAENELEQQGPAAQNLADCNVNENLVKINLISAHDTSYGIIPNGIYFDLVDEGNVVVSRKFSSTNFIPTVIYVRAGIYNMSLRQNDNFNGSVFTCYAQPVNTSSTVFKSGSYFNFQAGTEYDVMVSNYVY